MGGRTLEDSPVLVRGFAGDAARGSPATEKEERAVSAGLVNGARVIESRRNGLAGDAGSLINQSPSAPSDKRDEKS